MDRASGDLDALADGLLANANDLAGRLATMSIDAYTMTQGAGALIEEVAQTKMTGEEDRYSRHRPVVHRGQHRGFSAASLTSCGRRSGRRTRGTSSPLDAAFAA